MINAIAIDDEPRALSVLENFCSKIDFIQLQKTFTKPTEAIRHLRENPVDLLFLDINMPSVSGIDLYKRFRNNVLVIFTTAHSEFAVEGFNLNALDYLLKPFTFERFQQAVNKAKQHLSKGAGDDDAGKHFFVRADYSFIKIIFSDILYIEGLDDYLRIHLASRKAVVARYTMKSILEKLPAENFIRVHRSYIIPLDRIISVRNRTITIENAEIPIGASYEENFFKVFKP